MEWPWSFQTGSGKTALIQLCQNPDVCYLFQVFTYKRLPNSLVQLLEHDKVTLNGSCVKKWVNNFWCSEASFNIWFSFSDIRKLARDFPNNNLNLEKLLSKCVDLRQMCNRVLNLDMSWSLAELCKHFLKRDMNKAKEVRASRWDNLVLTKPQINYAAIDVYVSICFF